MARTPQSIALGVLLRQYRLAMRWTQEELAHASGLDRKFIWLVENGRQMPSLENLFKLADVLQVAAAVLVARLSSLKTPVSPKERERPRRVRQPLVSSGKETCPKCKAVYIMEIRRSDTRETGRFTCGFCKRELGSWAGTFELYYSVQFPPRRWPTR